MLTKDFEEPLREVAYMNKEDHDGIFPIDNCVIELRSDDHTPPHIHWLKDGYNIAFYIKSGDFYKYGHGNKEAYDDLPSLTQNIKKWLKKVSKMSVDGKTNEQMCVQLWIVFHNKSDFKAGYITELFQFLEMSTLRKTVTGLPVNIWVDDCGVHKQSGHANRIKFQGNTEDCPVLSSICEMTIDDLKVIGDLSKTNLTDRDIKEIETFVLNNKELLHQLGNAEIDIFEFKDRMICNG